MKIVTVLSKQNERIKTCEDDKKENKKCISFQCVCSVKENKGSVSKSHQVAYGFNEDSINTSEKESPTGSKDTLRTILTAIISNNWNIKSVDIKTAFLQGENLICGIYLKPPPKHIVTLAKLGN